jgi:hypothetical protein
MLKKEFLILFFALGDKRTGFLPKSIALVALLYLSHGRWIDLGV